MINFVKTVQEDDQKLSDESLITSPEVLASTSAPDFLTTPTKSKHDGTNLTGLQDQSAKESDLKSMSSHDLTKKTKSSGKISENAVNRANAAYQKFQESSPYNQSLENLYLKKGKQVLKAAHKRTLTHPLAKPVTVESDNKSPGWDESTKVEIAGKQKTTHSRSRSQPNSQPGKKSYDDPLFDKVRNAKKVAENAIKVSKNLIIFL